MSKKPPPPSMERYEKNKAGIPTPPPPVAPPIPNSPLMKESIAKAKISNVFETVEIDFKKVRKPFNIDDPIDWDGIKAASVSESDSGNDGVFFLQTKDDKIFILKGSMFLADEIYSSRISEFLGIKTPRTDLIEYKPSCLSKRSKSITKYGNDWYAAKEALSRCGKKNLRVKLKLDRNLFRAFYILMEFIPGNDMFSKSFKSEEIFKSRRHLNDLGRIFVFDIVQNNHDRFPVPDLFKHEGNANNLMFLPDYVVAIDQCVSPFVKDVQKQNYLNQVKKIVDVHCKKKFIGNEYIEAIVDFVKANKSFEIDEEGKKEIWRGMDDAFKIIFEGKRINRNVLERKKKEVAKLITGHDWADVFADSTKKIDVKFISNVLKVIVENYELD